MVQGDINRGRHTDHLAGRHSIRTNQCPPPPSPHIFYGPDALPAAQPTVKALKANKVYTKVTVKCFKSSYFYQTQVYYYVELPKTRECRTPTSKILRVSVHPRHSQWLRPKPTFASILGLLKNSTMTSPQMTSGWLSTISRDKSPFFRRS